MKAIVLLRLMSGNNLFHYTHRKHSMEAVNSSAMERKKIKKKLVFLHYYRITRNISNISVY